MKLIALITVLCGAVSGDISEIINQSRKYLPPSREYLPPLLPEYQQPQPEVPAYVQYPPQLTDAVEVISTISPNNAASSDVLHEAEFYIPVQVVIEKTSDSALRQYLPPLIVPQSSEKLSGYEETTTYSNENSSEAPTTNFPQSREFFGSTHTDIPSLADIDSTVSSKVSDELLITDLKDSALFTTTIPDSTTFITAESIETTTVSKETNQVILENEINPTTSITTLDVASTESVTDAIETVTVAEDISSTTLDWKTEIDTTVSTPINNETIDLKSVNVDREGENDDTEKTSTAGHTEVTTSIPVAVDIGSTENTSNDIEGVSTFEGIPLTTSPPFVGKIASQNEPDSDEIVTTTISEYIQNGQKLEVATKEISSESTENGLIHNNNIELNEVSTIEQNEVSTPETLLLEDGYHYSIPSIIFGSFNI